MATNMTVPGAHYHAANNSMNDNQKFQREPSLTPMSSRSSSRSQMNGTMLEIPGTFGRSSVFGSCAQVLGIVTTTLFQAVADYKFYMETTSDNNTTRKAKLLYVSLLEKVQKERGEWCGFEENDAANKDKKKLVNPMEVLKTALIEMAREDAIAVLNELMEVSFRNLRGSLVASDLYTRHKKAIASAGMDCPPPLNTLLVVRTLLNEMERDEKICLFRLLSLWHVIVLANVHQDLRRIIEDKHTLVFSESSEMDFMTTSSRHKGNRYDPIAVGLLQVLVQYREILFSDIEFLLIKQELQFPQSLLPSSTSIAATTATTTSSTTYPTTAQVETDGKEEESQPQQSETEDDELEMDHRHIPLAVAVEEVPQTEEEDDMSKSTSTNNTASSNYAPRGRFQSAVSPTGASASSTATSTMTEDNKNGNKPQIVAVRVERAQSCASPTYSTTRNVKNTSMAIAPVQYLSTSPAKSPVMRHHKLSRRRAKQLQLESSSSEKEEDEEESDESDSESDVETNRRSNMKTSSKSSSSRRTRHKSHKKRTAITQDKENSADERAIASYVALSVAVTICAVATIAIFAFMKAKKL